MAKDDPAATVPRRLAALLSADVAGYTRLMNADEPATLRLLAACRAIIDRLIAGHGGRIANTAGDSVLAEFRSAAAALQCALGIQDRVASLNAEVPEDRRVRFRIGLHVGEVAVRDGDLLGDGVNIAARMQTLAPPGAVCLSETAHQFTRSAVPATYESLGPQSVKNLDAPIVAFLVRPSGQAPASAIPSVHRRIEAHLARRFHDICHDALLAITRTDDLKVIEYSALASLEDAPDTDERTLATRIGIAPAKAPALLRRLVSRGLVEVAAGGGRGSRRVYRLTARGLSIRRKLRPAIAAALDGIVAPLSEPERETLKDLLVRIIQAHEAKDRNGS